MNITFIGYRCSGKTTISKKLEDSLIGWKRVEIDEEIKNIFKLDIPEIIKKYGWKKFRSVEKRIIKKFSKKDNMIIDAGGGAILNKNNIKNLKKNGMLIFLNCSIESLYERLNESYKRPALTELSLNEEIIKVLSERLPLYKKYSDYTINTDLFTLEQAAYHANCLFKERDNLENDYNYSKMKLLKV